MPLPTVDLLVGVLAMRAPPSVVLTLWRPASCQPLRLGATVLVACAASVAPLVLAADR